MNRIWVMVANSMQARCFEQGRATGTALEPLATFSCPQGRSKGVDLTADRSGHEEMGHGRGSSSYGPRLDARAKVREEFARDLAHFLNAGIAAHRCNGLIVLAAPPFLGRIKLHLSRPASRVLAAAIGRNLVDLDDATLVRRIRDEVPRATWLH